MLSKGFWKVKKGFDIWRSIKYFIVFRHTVLLRFIVYDKFTACF